MAMIKCPANILNPIVTLSPLSIPRCSLKALSVILYLLVESWCDKLQCLAGSQMSQFTAGQCLVGVSVSSAGSLNDIGWECGERWLMIPF